MRYQGEQHFVIVDWSKNAELAIQEILNTDSETEIVLIDTLEKTPIVHKLISDGDQLNFNRKLDQLIPEDALLFVICDIEHISVSLQTHKKDKGGLHPSFVRSPLSSLVEVGTY